mmetsp:Transcript_8936/g.16916  ORF Transcript_8936/g.16916 Transcript_8936/m.16916 type:complete len:81 (-) Transcript_8936:1194-1436(-)
MRCARRQTCTIRVARAVDTTQQSELQFKRDMCDRVQILQRTHAGMQVKSLHNRRASNFNCNVQMTMGTTWETGQDLYASP